jgi:nicotinate-nucleotide adenylyltransferase
LKRLGLFGGTFDPIHVAHLVLAEQAREQLKLDRVLFMPSAQPPHKLDREISPAKLRLEMVELAVAGFPEFEVSYLEVNREGPSYTVDTLKAVKTKHPDAELFLLLGGDMLADFPNWRSPDEILSLATLGVMQRDGSPTEPPLMLAGKVQTVNAPLLDISGTDLRRRVKEGRSIRFFVPAAVEAFIRSHGLYGSAKEPALR